MMICGYRGTGKDVLASQLSQPAGQSSPIPFNWLILRAYPDVDEEIVPFDLTTARTRVASADELKRQVMIEEGLDLNDYTEELKSQVIRDGKTFRDILIETAMSKREQDPVYWIRNAYQTYVDRHSDDPSYVISDWRFPNELAYLQEQGQQPITVRVFRPTVERVDTVSETSLDDVLTDFVLFNDQYVMEQLSEYWTPEEGQRDVLEWAIDRNPNYRQNIKYYRDSGQITDPVQLQQTIDKLRADYRLLLDTPEQIEQFKEQMDMEIEQILSNVISIITHRFPQYSSYIFENV